MRSIIIIALSLAVLASCEFWTSETSHRVVDSAGRERVFRGTNAVYKPKPYVPITDHFDPKFSLCDEDFANMQKWGFNIIRLGLIWEAVEPKRGVYDNTYINKMAAIVDSAQKYGIQILIDIHQDLLSREFCGEGAADWAIAVENGTKPFPHPVNVKLQYEPDTGYPTINSCLQKTFGEYYLTHAVASAFQTFYQNSNGVRTAFAKMWGQLTQIFSKKENVIGYELINEPSAGDFYRHPSLLIPGNTDKEYLEPMYNEIYSQIRSIDKKKLIFFEKATTNVVGPLGFTSVPGGNDQRNKTIFAHHNYCMTVDRDGDPKWLELCKGEQLAFWDQSMHDVKKLQTGVMMTEFGAVNGNNTAALEALEYLMQKTDEDIQSWAYWQYKPFGDFTTASSDAESLYSSDGTLQTEKLKLLSRPYPMAIAGHGKSFKFDPKKNIATFVVEPNTKITQPTILHAGVVHYPNGYKVVASPSDSCTISYKSDASVEIYWSQSAAKEVTFTISPK